MVVALRMEDAKTLLLTSDESDDCVGALLWVVEVLNPLLGRSRLLRAVSESPETLVGLLLAAEVDVLVGGEVEELDSTVEEDTASFDVVEASSRVTVESLVVLVCAELSTVDEGRSSVETPFGCPIVVSLFSEVEVAVDSVALCVASIDVVLASPLIIATEDKASATAEASAAAEAADREDSCEMASAMIREPHEAIAAVSVTGGVLRRSPVGASVVAAGSSWRFCMVFFVILA